ncbi:hypothetical protein EON63_21040, partial [archaeon]
MPMVAFCDGKKTSNPTDPLDCLNPVCGEKMRLFQDMMHKQKGPSKSDANSSSKPSDPLSAQQQAPQPSPQ